jgi:hypothetical protein
MSIKSTIEPDASSRSSFLTTLPAEIRSTIYEILIANYIISTDPRSGRIRIAEESSRKLPVVSGYWCKVYSKSSFESLPLVCRQISREYQRILKITCTCLKVMRFAESDATRRDRAMSLSPSNIKQRLREPSPNPILKQVESILIEHKNLVTIIRPIEERFFSSLRRISIWGVSTEQAETDALQQIMIFRGYKTSEERPVEGIWNFDYDERMNEYMMHRRLSFAHSALASGLINPTLEARAIRRMSDARAVEAQPGPF